MSDRLNNWMWLVLEAVWLAFTAAATVVESYLLIGVSIGLALAMCILGPFQLYARRLQIKKEVAEYVEQVNRHWIINGLPPPFPKKKNDGKQSL